MRLVGLRATDDQVCQPLIYLHMCSVCFLRELSCINLDESIKQIPLLKRCFEALPGEAETPTIHPIIITPAIIDAIAPVPALLIIATIATSALPPTTRPRIRPERCNQRTACL